MQVKAHITEVARPGKIFNSQQFVPDLCLFLGEEIADFMPDHVFHEHFFIAFLYIPGSDVVCIAEYRCSVCQTENIFKPVRNQNNRNAFVAQLPCNAVQLFTFTFRQCSCRLIHNQDAWILRKGFCNFNQLLLCNGKGTDRRCRREVCSHAVQKFLCFSVCL